MEDPTPRVGVENGSLRGIIWLVRDLPVRSCLASLPTKYKLPAKDYRLVLDLVVDLEYRFFFAPFRNLSMTVDIMHELEEVAGPRTKPATAKPLAGWLWSFSAMSIVKIITRL
jgi:hypothetical protein